MSNSKQPRIDWKNVPKCYVLAPVCQHCGSPDYKLQRSETYGDGSVTQLALCDDCGKPYKILIDLPDFGNDALPGVRTAS